MATGLPYETIGQDLFNCTNGGWGVVIVIVS